MEQIISKDNQKIKLARALVNKKDRRKQGCFLAEGLRLCREALLCRWPLRMTFVSDQAREDVRQLAEEAEQGGCPVYELPQELLNGISDTCHCQGIVMLLEARDHQPLPRGGHCYALCDGVADPGNLGTIMRSAYAAGVSGLLLAPGCTDPYNPKTVRSAMGALFRLPLHSCTTQEEALTICRELELQPLVTAMDGRDIRQAGDLLQKPHLWLLGSEAEGVSDFWRQNAAAAISLPMREQAESLNVAAAAAVLFYQSFFVDSANTPCPSAADML